LAESLTGPHDVEVTIWSDIERREHLIEQLPVLRRHAHANGEKSGAPLHAVNDGAQLDGFWSRPEDE
jgi:hypothetical protein